MVVCRIFIGGIGCGYVGCLWVVLVVLRFVGIIGSGNGLLVLLSVQW